MNALCSVSAKQPRSIANLLFRHLCCFTRGASTRRDAQPPAVDGGAVDGSVDKLTYLLRSLGLARYETMFTVQEVDFEAFLHLSEDDLAELDVARKDREKLVLVIDELRAKLGI